MTPPKYVMVGVTEMRLEKDGKSYWRPAGMWRVGFRVDDDGNMFSVSSVAHVNDLPITEITEEEFIRSNRGYL